MTPSEVEAYLREHIPLSGSMEIAVREATPDRVHIEVPLPPNVNHHATAFGGSVAALAILAGWTMVHVRLREDAPGTQLVIQSSSVHYDKPIHSAFSAVASRIDERTWQRFIRAITKHGKGRIHVEVRVSGGDGVAATFTGAYVGLAP